MNPEQVAHKQDFVWGDGRLRVKAASRHRRTHRGASEPDASDSAPGASLCLLSCSIGGKPSFASLCICWDLCLVKLIALVGPHQVARLSVARAD